MTAENASAEPVDDGIVTTDWDDFLDYDLPPELIAQRPLARREDARLLVLDRATGALEHRCVAELPSLLRGGDCVVANDSRVVRARLVARKSTGGVVELLVLREATAGGRRQAICRSAKPLRAGQLLQLEDGYRVRIAELLGGGRCTIDFEESTVDEVLGTVGQVPLPPYVHRDAGPEADDVERYQTVYADAEGSVAAPTAGLHFSRELIAGLYSRAIEFATVTLHVGPGTFRPIRGKPDQHSMEAEQCVVRPGVAFRINSCRRVGGRIVAVGTTTVRTLETAVQADEEIHPFEGPTSLFIRPGHVFRAVDVLLTNFHLPRTTLLCLVMAFGGCDAVRQAYAEAVRERYRFYSYGDAMLVL